MVRSVRAKPVVILLVMVIGAGALAGCTDEPAPEAQRGPETIVHTRPGDIDLNATADSNAFHLHDYWNGQEILTVVDETQVATVTAMGVEVNRLQFKPPPGTVLPLGTGKVTVVVTWEAGPDSLYGTPQLYLKTAIDDVSVAAGELTSGGEGVIETTNEQADLPHQLISAWSFDFYLVPDPGTDILRFEGDVHFLVIAHRTLDIPLFPPHPDHWNGATEKPLLANGTSAGELDHPPAPNKICYGGCLAEHVPEAPAIVPPGTGMVRVVITHESPDPDAFVLHYHAADTRDWVALQPTASEGDTRVYDIAVQPGQADGPYAKASLWVFLGVTAQTADTGNYQGTYTIEATAYRAA